ncbi:MAG: hypothetical protein KDI15_13730, partial [Thiothrix sp.]|nr:hypothetical protein [Thiothrix sp.]
VMRECVASIGLLDLPEKYAKNLPFSAKGRQLRTRFPEIFVNLVEYPKPEWKYENPEISSKIPEQTMSDYREVVKPLFERLEAAGITGILHNFVREMNKYRNGFAHAWTAKAGTEEDISEKGRSCYGQLLQVIRRLKEEDFIH